MSPPSSAAARADRADDVAEPSALDLAEQDAMRADRTADSHPGLYALARHLVDTIAPHLDLEPGMVRVALGTAADPARRVGAQGLAGGTTLHLAADEPSLASTAGRTLVAHEMAHLAQLRAPNVAPDDPDADLTNLVAEAEAEARAIGHAAATGNPLWRPRRPLPAGTAIADTGAVVAPKPPTKPGQRTAPSQAPPGSPRSVTIGLAAAHLGDKVAARYEHLLDRLRRIADRLWVDGDDLTEALTVVSTLSFLEARALFGNLNGTERLDLAEELEDGHHREFPTQALALLCACPPIIARNLDADNVAALDPGTLGGVERAAAREMLRGVNQNVLRELLDGDRALTFRLWVAEYPGAVDDLAALRQATKELNDRLDAEQKELDRDEGAADAVKKSVAEVTDLLKSPSTDSARRALRLLADLHPTEPAATDTVGQDTEEPKPKPKPATSTETTPAGPPEPNAKLRRAVRLLEQAGRIEVLLDSLSGEDRTAGSDRAGQLLLVLAARDPGLNLAKAEDLLSYKFFDWAVTDAEARYAYVLLRAVPTALQDRFLTRDNGKWFQRLEENLPATDILTGRYRGLGSNADPFDYATSNEVVTDAMTVVWDVHVALEKEDIDGGRAIQLIEKIIDLGRRPGQMSPELPGAGLRGRIQVACSRLDALGDIDRLLELVPEQYLLQEGPRQKILELMAARQPAHLQRSARKLLDTGFFSDWAVTGREAWLAFYVIRSLTPHQQKAFAAHNPDLWDKLQSEMTAEMRQSTAITNLGGATTFTTRDRIRDRLRDPTLWLPLPARQRELRSLIIQLQALDDGAWVFRTSKEMLAGKSEADLRAMADLIADRRLYQPKVRERYQPEQLTTPDLEGPIQFLAEAAGYLRLLPAVLQIARSMFTDTLKVTNLDLGTVAQTVGDDIMGMQVASDEQVADLDRKEAAAASSQQAAGQKKALAQQANRLGLTIHPGDGIVTVTLPRLEATRMNRAFPGSSIRTGRISIRGLKLTASFSDRGYNRPIGAEADIASADVDDTVVASESVPGGTLAATDVGLTTLHLKTGRTGTEDLTADRDDDWISIPILDPFLHVLSHIVAFNGSVPGLSGLLAGALTGPGTAGSGLVAEQAASYSAEQVISPLVDGLTGLVTDGVFRKPKTVGERAAEATDMLRSFELSFTSLDIQGISLAGIQQAESLSIKNFAVAFGLTKPTMLRHHKRTLERRLADQQTPVADRSTIGAEITRISKELERLEPMEAELNRLEGRFRWHDKSLSDEERSRLRTLTAELRADAGAAIDVGHIGVGRLSGRVEAAGLDVAGVHGTASLPTRAGEYLPADDLIARLRAERSAKGQTDKDLLDQTKFDLRTGTISLRKPADPDDPALVVKAGVLPAPAAVERQIARLEKYPVYRDSKFLEDLRTWPDKLRYLAQLESVPREPVDLSGKPVWRKGPGGKPRPELGPVIEYRPSITKRQALRAEAERFFGLSIKSLELGPAFATLAPGGGPGAKPEIQVGVSTLEAAGITTGATIIGSVSGTDVALGLALDPSAVTRSLPGGAGEVAREGYETGGVSIGAGSLTFRDVKQPGLDLGRLTVNGVQGRVVPDGDNWRIPSLVIASAELEGLSYTDGTTTYYATGTTRSGRIDMSIRVLTRPGPDPGTREMSELLIDWLHFDRIEADKIGRDVGATRTVVATREDGSVIEEISAGSTMELTSGAMVGLEITGMRVPFAAEDSAPQDVEPVTGTIGIDRFDNLRFRVVSKALQGKPTTTTGTLHGGVPAGSAAARAVTVRMLDKVQTQEWMDKLGIDGKAEKGSMTIDLAGGELLNTTVETADGTITFRRMGLSGRIGMVGNRTTFEHMGPFNLDIASIDWTAGSAHIRATGSTVLEGVTADGWYESTPTTEKTPGGGGKPKAMPGTMTVHLDRLEIRQVRSDDLRYTDGVLDVHLGRSGKAGPIDKATRKPDNLDIANVKVHGLHWDSVQGLTGGSVQTGKVKAAFGGRLSGDLDKATGAVTNALHLKGSLTAAGIRLDFRRGGRIMARATGIIGEVGLGGTGDADDHHLTWGDETTGEGLDTGFIDITKNQIDIGPDGHPGMALNSLRLDKLSWNFTGTTSGFGLHLPEGKGLVSMQGITARVRILLHPAGSKEAKTEGRLKKILLRELVVADTKATGLGVRFGPAVLRLDSTQVATLGQLSLRAPKDEDGFVIDPSQSMAKMLKGGIDIARMVDGSPGISLPNVAADIEKQLTGTANIAAASLGVDFFGAEGMSVKLTEPSITQIQLVLEGDSKLKGRHIHTLSLFKGPKDPLSGLPSYGLRADELTYTDKPGEKKEGVSVKGLGVSGLEYRNSKKGVHVTVVDARVPNLEHDFGASSGSIDKLVIDKAFVQLRIPTLLADESGAKEQEEASEAKTVTTHLNDIATALMPYADIVDSLKGSLGLTIHADDLSIPIKTTFVDGAFDYQAVYSSAAKGLPWYASGLQFRVRHNDLMLGLITYNARDQENIFPILSWPLGSDEALAGRGRLKILRALKPQLIYNPKIGGPPDPSAAPTRFEIDGVDADLSTKNPKPIPLNLGRYGTVTLAPNAVSHLKVKGSVGGHDKHGNATAGLLKPISLDTIRIQSTDLTIPTGEDPDTKKPTGSVDVKTQGIEITDIIDADLSFHDMAPQSFSAVITKAEAKGVNWTIKKGTK